MSASCMGAEFADWMWKKKDEEARTRRDKSEMYKGLINVNEWGKAGLSHFADSRAWDEVAAVIGDWIAFASSAMGPEFVEWLLVKTDTEGWSVEQVYEILIGVNHAGRAGLTHCADKTIWNKVASVVGDDIAKCASAMGPEFTEWLLVKTQEEESWDVEKVYKELVKVNKAGRTALAHIDDSSTWDEVAAVIGLDITESAVAMTVAFKEWLVLKSGVWTRLCRVDEERTEKHQTALCNASYSPQMWTTDVGKQDGKGKQEGQGKAKGKGKRKGKGKGKDKTINHYLSNASYSPQMWTTLSMCAPQHSLHFRVYNGDLAQALLNWHTALGAVGEEEEAELLRTLIKKKGVVLEMVIEDNQVLESAVNFWTERNKEFSE